MPKHKVLLGSCRILEAFWRAEFGQDFGEHFGGTAVLSQRQLRHSLGGMAGKAGRDPARLCPAGQAD